MKDRKRNERKKQRREKKEKIDEKKDRPRRLCRVREINSGKERVSGHSCQH